MKVRDNGFLAIEAYDRSETIRLGLDIENARSNLRQLDAKVHGLATKLRFVLRLV